MPEIEVCPECLGAGIVGRDGVFVICDCAIDVYRERVGRRCGLKPSQLNSSFDAFDMAGADPEVADLRRRAYTFTRAIVDHVAYKRERGEMSGVSFLHFFGRQGRGKTYLAEAAVNYLTVATARSGYLDVTARLGRFITEETFAEALQTRIEGHEERPEEYFDRVADYGLLVLDDFAIVPRGEWLQQRIWQLFEQRYLARRPFITTSNYPLDVALTRLLPYHKERYYSRFLERGLEIEFKGEDRRIEGAVTGAPE